jgi:hypothetical protein
MIDLQNERILPLAEAAKSLPNRPHLATIARWGTRGCRNVVLETLLLGGRRVTSAEALERFFTRVTAAAHGVPAQAETPRQRERQIERAERRAEELGL